MKTKTCPKCKETKNVGEFHKNKTRKDGLAVYCKSCIKAYQEANKEKMAEYKKVWDEANKEKTKAYYEANKDKITKQKKAYYKANKEKIAEQKKAYKNYKYNNDPLFKLKAIYRKSVREAFISIGKKKTCSSIKVLGLNNYKEYADYLSNQFYDHPVTGEKMTFDNHGSGEDCWQIDHIVPLLTAETEEDVIRLSHYTNLQPLWGVDHLKKTVSDLKNC